MRLSLGIDFELRRRSGKLLIWRLTPPPLVRIGLRDGFSCEVGDQEYLRQIYGLSPEAIVRRVKEAFSPGK